VGDVERADDLAQAAFLRAFAALPRYEAREGVPFECWLFTIVRNCAHTALEKERRQLLVEPADLAERADREQSLDPPAACSGSWIGDERLQRHYMRLPLAQRQVLALRFGFDFDGARTASVLGRTVTDVNTIQHRALRQLAAWLKPQPRPFEGAATT
jgi:RNA polymerase sigma-70 factor (ECF subfamily)